MNEIYQISYFELLGVFFALLYIYLAIKEIRSCWIAAILSCIFYIPTFFNSKLYTETVLQFFFIVASAYGWMSWKSKAGSVELRIGYASLRENTLTFIISLSCSMALGLFCTTYTKASFPYLDSLISCFSVSGTILQAKKKIDNWVYWIIIDSIAIYVYIQKELFLTAILYGIFVILACLGLKEWLKKYQDTCNEYSNFSKRRF